MNNDAAGVSPLDVAGIDKTRNSSHPPTLTQAPVDVRSVSLAVLAVLAVVYILNWAQAFFIPVMLGIMISYAFSPIVNGLQAWHIPRVIGAALVLIVIVGGPSLAVYALSDEANALIETLPEATHKLRRVMQKENKKEGAFDKVQKAASELEKAAAESTAPSTIAPQGVTLVQMQAPKLNLRDFLWTGTIGALAAAGQALVVLFLAYFLMVSGDTFRRKMVKITGPTLTEKKVTVKVLDEITDQIQRFLLIQVFTSVLVGVLSWLAFTAFGLKNAAIWGILAGVCNIIPYLGPVIVAGGIALVSFLQFGTVGIALVISVTSLAITSLEGFLLTPWLTGRAARMNAAVVFVAVLFWGWLWGAWGLLLGVPIVMIIKSVCDHVEDLKPIGELLGS
ncbi:MAG: AI-2E family transporter [Burkholderiales bacterium]|nr:AI-2E family transporter [Burkholderiales bacterium]